MNDDLYQAWLDELGVKDEYVSDDYAADLLYYGWFASDAEFAEGVDPDRFGYREEFYEYMDLNPSDIDWVSWKEYMGYEE